jgi:hypothetical protein
MNFHFIFDNILRRIEFMKLKNTLFSFHSNYRIHNNTTQHNTTPHHTPQHHTTQHHTTQHHTTPHNTTEHNKHNKAK